MVYSLESVKDCGQDSVVTLGLLLILCECPLNMDTVLFMNVDDTGSWGGGSDHNWSWISSDAW